MSHALFSPSSTDRWVNCSASLIQDSPNTSSVYAERGTAAHAYLESLLLDTETEQVSYLLPEDIKAVQEAYEYILSVPYTKLYAEQRLENPELWFDFFGTADAVLIDEDNKFVHVMDYKNGSGVPVGIYMNQQMLSYAALYLSLNPWAEGWLFYIHVLQPKRNNMNKMAVSTQELHAHIATVNAAIKRYFSGDNQEKPGAWCKFCPRRYKTCKASLW